MKLFHVRKSQIATTDLIVSAIILLLFISIIITVLLWSDNKRQTYVYESAMFKNIENQGNNAFLVDYRLNSTKLSNFQASNYIDMKRAILNGTEFVDNLVDMCFFIQKGHSIYNVDVGGISCSVTKPCADDSVATTYAKPMLNGTIKNFLIVVCS